MPKSVETKPKYNTTPMNMRSKICTYDLRFIKFANPKTSSSGRETLLAPALSTSCISPRTLARSTMSKNSNLPTFAPSTFMVEWHKSRGLPPPPAQTRSWPPGTRVACVRSGVELDLVGEIVAFCAPGTRHPPGIDTDLIVDPTSATYIMRYNNDPQLEVITCEELHDPAEWRRLDKTDTTGCAQCSAQDASLKCSACRGARYCGRECQKAHWVIHKPRCLRARGMPVEASVTDAAEAAMREREHGEYEKLLADVSLVAPKTDGRVVIGSGLFLGFDNFHKTNLEAALQKAGIPCDSVDIHEDPSRQALAKDCCAGKVRFLVLLGVGSDGNTEVILRDTFFRAAITHVVKEGGWVLLQGEGRPCEVLLERSFGKKWKCTSYSRYSVALNEKWIGDKSRFGSLDDDAFLMKTVACSEVPVEERLFCEGEATMMAVGKSGKGWIGFVGDVNSLETPTMRAIAVLAGIARS